MSTSTNLRSRYQDDQDQDLDDQLLLSHHDDQLLLSHQDDQDQDLDDQLLLSHHDDQLLLSRDHVHLMQISWKRPSITHI